MSNTNEPAFPTEVWDSRGIPQHTQGMTLRDYFAAKAMQGLLSDNEFSSELSAQGLATAAYDLADAMLQVRSQ